MNHVYIRDESFTIFRISVALMFFNTDYTLNLKKWNYDYKFWKYLEVKL